MPRLKNGALFFLKMKISEIQKEAKNIIADIFSTAIKSENKEDWVKALNFIVTKIFMLEN